MIDPGLKLRLSLQLQRYLPWRLADRLDGYNDAALREKYREWLAKTPPVPAVADSPTAEVHQLLGHRHIGMGLWSLKSLLSATQLPLGVTIHSDGSLTADDVEFAQHHIPGVRVIAREDADAAMKERLHDLPACSSFRFGEVPVTNHRGQSYNMFIMALILFDIPLLSRADKVMILDADVLFFKPSPELSGWVEPGNRQTFYSVEGFRPIRQPDGSFEYGQKVARTLNSGLLCLTKSQVYDLAKVEEWVGANPDLMYTSPVFEQLCYSYLVKPHPEAVELDPALYGFNYTTPDSIATHFGIKRGFYENLHRAERVLSA
jgi:hypothetical protein